MTCECGCCYWCTRPPAHPSPSDAGDDDPCDLFDVDDPAMIAHFDSLGFDVSFRS